MKSRFTFGDISKIKSKILSSDISTLSYKNMALSFIGEITGKNVRQMPFNELIGECNKVDWLHIDFSYKNEFDFYRQFCNEKMWIKDEPISNYFSIRKSALDKIKEIEERLKKLYSLRTKAKLKQLTIKNIENYNENYSLISFYIEKNKKALSEIKSFLINGIDKKAVSRSLKSPFSGSVFEFAFFIDLFPYQNHWLDLAAHSVLAHRYGDLPVPTARSVFKLYDDYLQNIKNDYVSIPFEFIDKYKKFDAILQYCKEHHILSAKSSLIKKSISLYKNKEYALVAILIPTLIEGLMNDVCEMYEIKHSDIYQHGFVKKIGFIQTRHDNKKIENSLHSLDYFRYFFPTIRNHMAHGWIEKSNEMKVLSGHLMLDLISACEIVAKADYKMNTHVNLIKKLRGISLDSLDNDTFTDFINYIKSEINNSPCHRFYKLKTTKKNLTALYLKKEFSDAVCGLITGDQFEFKRLCSLISEVQKTSMQMKNTKYIVASQSILSNMRIDFKEKYTERRKKSDVLLKLLKSKNIEDD